MNAGQYILTICNEKLPLPEKRSFDMLKTITFPEPEPQCDLNPEPEPDTELDCDQDRDKLDLLLNFITFSWHVCKLSFNVNSGHFHFKYLPLFNT